MKRLSPSSDTNDLADQPVKKTHRTHEENQERAYIAASRRADRDIEHRIRSAIKASECRRKRTGRGLKITREAVMGDEQYESEEEDHTARRFSLPAGVPAGSAGAVAGAGVTNGYFSSPTDRYDEIGALFTKSFPHIKLNSCWAAQQEQEQVQQRQRQQQLQQGQPQTQTHRHSYSHPYTPANTAISAAAAAAAADNGYTPRSKQNVPAPIHTHLQPQPSLVDHSPHSPHSPMSAAANTPLSGTSGMSYPLPPAHGGEHVAGASAHGLGLMGANGYLIAPHSSPSSPGMAVFGAAGYPLDVESGGSDGSPMGGGDEYYYSGPVSPSSPLGVGMGGDNINDEPRGTLLNGIDFAGAGAEAAWLASGAGGVHNGVNGNGGVAVEGPFYARSLSLPDVLDQFQFPGGFDSATAAAAAAAAADGMMIDPSILSSAASVAMPSQEGGVGGAAAAPESVKEAWSDWVNFDAEVKV